MTKKVVTGGLIIAITLFLGSKTVMALGYRHHAEFSTEDWKHTCNHVVGECPYIQDTVNQPCVNCSNNNGNNNNNMNTSTGTNQGSNFVDQNGNGVCDNYENRVQPQNGTGHHYGHHGRHHR